MYKRAKRVRESAVKTVELRSMRLSLALVTLVATLLYQASDVEMNPGPGSNSKTVKQTHLDTPVRRESTDRITGKKAGEKDSPQTEPTLTSLMELLTGMKQDLAGGLDSVNVRLDSLGDSVAGIREEVGHLYETVSAINKENEVLKKQNQELLDKLEVTEKKLDDLEGRSKRNNFIFNGLKRTAQNESWDDCEKLVKDVIHNQLKIEGNIGFERVHRLSSGPDSPIITCFLNFKDKQRVLKEKKNLKESQTGKSIFIGEDFSKRVRDTRRLLLPFLKKAKSEKKQAFLKFDSLMIDGKAFDYDRATQGLKERPQR